MRWEKLSKGKSCGLVILWTKRKDALLQNVVTNVKGARAVVAKIASDANPAWSKEAKATVSLTTQNSRLKFGLSPALRVGSSAHNGLLPELPFRMQS